MTNNQSGVIGNFLKFKKIAVVGSFKDETKVAYSIVRHLISAKKYEIFPVNPNKKEIDGIKVYKSVSDLPEGIEGIDLVTPPDASLQILPECLKKGITNVWLQPGASDDRVLSFCNNNNISCIHDVCIMVFS